MAKVNLTDRLLRGWLRNPPDQRAEYFDKHVRGFGLRVSPEGTLTFFVRRRVGRSRPRYPIGRYPEVSLASARAKARAIGGHVAEGRDPRRPHGISLDELAQKYLEAAQYRKGQRTWSEECRLYRYDVYPVLGHLPAAEITTDIVLDLLTAVFRRAVRSHGGRGSIALNVKRLIGRIFRHGMILKVVSHSPVDLLPGNVFAAAASKPRDRVLRDDEIRILWPVWAAAGAAGAALQAVLLTAQRPHREVSRMRWEDIGDDNWWLLSDTKTQRPNRIYMTPLARSLLPPKTCEWVFPKPSRPEQPVNLPDYLITIRKKSGIADWAPHDLRRTAATGLARFGVEEKIIDIILNHAPATVSKRHYIWWKYQDQVRQALIQWSDHLAELCGALR